MLNGGMSNIPISTVTVTLFRNPGIASYPINLYCPRNYVPYSSQAYQYGQLVCTFSQPITKSWSSAKASVGVGSSAYATTSASSSSSSTGGSYGYMPTYIPPATQTCSSPVVSIHSSGSQPIIVYADSSAGSSMGSSGLGSSGPTSSTMSAGTSGSDDSSADF